MKPTALRGDVSALAVARESLRRVRVAASLWRERARLRRGTLAAGAPRLRAEFASLQPSQLLAHFRSRAAPKFPPGLEAAPAEIARLAREKFPRETGGLIERARRVVEENRWALLGCGEFDFGARVDWLRDPLSGARWSDGFHADVDLSSRGDGSDARVLWELNRLGHLVALGQAYAVTSDERLAEKFFADVGGWRAQNPAGRGANWASAMEVALRAVNLLAAFRLFLRSPQLDGERLTALLATFDEHGEFVRNHLEFSHLATGNHYLSNVVGLVWLGLLLPELEAARGWREFGVGEMAREMEKQVRADGAHYESSTGYHRFAAELFNYTRVLCRANGVELPPRFENRAREMLEYARDYLKPSLRAPLLGDADNSRLLPLAPRAADGHAYLPGVVAALDRDHLLRVEDAAPFELLWLLGAEGLEAYASLPPAPARRDAPASSARQHAGVYVLREGDLYLLMSAAGAGLRGRGSHAHNDALSVEVSACGSDFICDPGSYVYTSDLRARHEFRSTAWHSTVEIDGAEQNVTDERAPFRIGDDARPRSLTRTTTGERDAVAAEHYGYARLREPVAHRRAAMLDKRRRLFLLADALEARDAVSRASRRGAAGAHTFRFFFHAGRGIAARVRGDFAELYDERRGTRLLIAPLDDIAAPPTVEPRRTSRDYGEAVASQSLCWTIRARAPLRVAWALVPVCADEDEAARLKLVEELRATGRDERWEF
ncbi:MAG: heparinase II/III family protein [Acidobacteria bacterium]|nr:heparinase II/III family protein [Acidobacteriota bacterium]